jgi:osmotically-inducible protein OsmY
MIRLTASSAFILSAFLISSLISGCTTTRHETSVAQYVASTGITFKVKENLIRDPDINSSRVAVNTFKDTVTLSGYIRDQFQEDKAIEIARNVKGVKYVVDNLTVTNA